MKSALSLIVLALLSAAAGMAQDPCVRPTPLTAQERIAQREIQSRIDQTLEADEAKDFNAKTRYFAPEFTLKLIDGSVVSRKETEAALKRDWGLDLVGERCDHDEN